ncbi:cell division protein [Streptomyces sp. M1013]|uniref:SsgA family sporulation/cell division regulator n=1 Tax=Streptomyces sp. M1013 TaxID=549798 RepID=UPI000978D949|nr:SsgA family sporulation/cell division regulator [Streptomyces sp. M1013]OMI85988.1 cell division protein [Streptomyces sp. M1013]
MKNCHLRLRIGHRVTSDFTVPLNCELSYRADDPLTVTVVFDNDAEWPVRWVLGRDLLAEGMTVRAGEGEVVLWPLPHGDLPASFCLQVGGARTALFEMPVGPVAEWLAGTYAMVPSGTELDGVNWDELVQLAD